MTEIKNRIIGSGEVSLDEILFNPRNWRVHPLNQQNALKGVLEEVGWVQEVIVNKRTGNLIDGHLRCQLAAREGAKTVPVKYVDLSEEEEALILSTLDPIAAMATTDREKLNDLFESINSDNENVQKLISEIAEKEGLYKPAKPEGKPNPRILPLDVIFTYDALYDPACTLAVRAGWKIGTQTTQKESGKPHTAVYQPERWQWLFDLSFLDNDYFNYDHTKHLEIVKIFKPKYATVRDAMTRDQCLHDGIEYYSFEQILDWADELSQYAENVIVIPKYKEALDNLPDKFIAGYSVPTSHGGTPIPVEEFIGKRVHLLGGSWKAQLAHLSVLGDCVVSIDNNYIQKQAQYGSFVYPEGETRQLTETLNLPKLTNPMYVCLAISLGSIGAKVNELYGGNGKPADLEKTDE